MARGPDKEYSNSYRSLEAIWTVLREHASKEHPLTVREICAYLKDMEGSPSPETVKRLFPREHTLMSLLYPGVVCEEEGGAIGAYHDGRSLHVIVETPEGKVLSKGEMGLEFTAERMKAPSYSTVDKLLKERLPFNMDSFPFRLQCVAQKRSPTGKIRYVPYDSYYASLDGEEEKNNQPRRYYLANVLTDAEWRIFSDLVQVYPYISQSQTRKFLTALNQFRPKRIPTAPGRYVNKRGSEEQFAVIAVLDEAIRDRKKVSITYGEYRLESRSGRWKPRLVPRRKNGELEVAPYALMWSNGNYYLVARHRGMMNLRVDRILSARIMKDTFERPADFDPVRYRDSSPVMYPGESAFVRLRCHTDLLGVLLDFFGEIPQYGRPDADGFTEVTMSIAPSGVKLFALQYAEKVEVLEPAALREEIARTLEEAGKKYRS